MRRAIFLAVTFVALSAVTGSAQSGGWEVKLDPMTEVLTALRHSYERLHAPVAVEGVAFDITKSVPSGGTQTVESDRDKRARIDGWQRDIASAFEDEDYDQVDDDELREKAGTTRAEMRNKMIDTMPFDQRESVERHTARELQLLLDNDADCAGDRGAIMAIVFGWYPDEGVAADYGHVAFFIVALGDCAGDAGAIRLAKRHVQSAFLRSIQGG